MQLLKMQKKGLLEALLFMIRQKLITSSASLKRQEEMKRSLARGMTCILKGRETSRMLCCEVAETNTAKTALSRRAAARGTAIAAARGGWAGRLLAGALSGGLLRRLSEKLPAPEG